MSLIHVLAILSLIGIGFFLADKYDDVDNLDSQFRSQLQNRLLFALVTALLAGVFAVFTKGFLPINPLDLVLGAVFTGLSWPIYYIIDHAYFDGDVRG
jgi:hypothetical protein